MITSVGLDVAELDAETARMLPERSALALIDLKTYGNFAAIYATNYATAVNDHSWLGEARADADQYIIVNQEFK